MIGASHLPGISGGACIRGAAGISRAANVLSQTLVFAAAVVAVLVSTAVRVSAADDSHSKVLGSVNIEPGQHTGDATTVNGAVEIGANAVVKHAETVNGSITLHEHSTADSVKGVNGSTRLEQGVRVLGNVELVNGHISLDKQADVSGRLTNVNGAIQLDAAHVGGGIETTNGDIDIGPNSRVEGGILVNKNGGGWFNFDSWKTMRVVIGPGAVVKGTLRFEREVKLYVSDRATIGAVEGATVNKFSGEHP
jgi:cytoskeletal protein CcmA (bactofilin family)